MRLTLPEAHDGHGEANDDVRIVQPAVGNNLQFFEDDTVQSLFYQIFSARKALIFSNQLDGNVYGLVMVQRPYRTMRHGEDVVSMPRASWSSCM